MALNFQNHTPARWGRLTFLVTIALSLICIGLYQAEGTSGPLHRMQNVVEGLVAPFQSVSAPLGALIDDSTTAADDEGADEATLSALREQNAQLIEQIASAEEMRQENDRLRNLLNLRDIYEIEGVSARVIGRTTDAWNQTVTIDAGEAAGVSSGMTVVGPTGVVGQVISVSGGTSRVRLLTDPQSGAAAMVQSSRAEGIVRGSMDGLLYLENIGADVNIQVGDVVLTSGLGGSYTRGLIIGTVARVEGSAGTNTRKIVVAPNDTATLLQEVIVVFSAADNSADRVIVTTLQSQSEDASEGSETESSDNSQPDSSDAESDTSTENFDEVREGEGE